MMKSKILYNKLKNLHKMNFKKIRMNNKIIPTHLLKSNKIYDSLFKINS